MVFNKNQKLQEKVIPLPFCYVATLPEDMQKEIKKKITTRLKEIGKYSPENVDRAMYSKIYDLEELLDIKEYMRGIEEQKQKEACKKKGGR